MQHQLGYVVQVRYCYAVYVLENHAIDIVTQY